MNKGELIDAIGSETNVTKKQVELVLNKAIEVIERTVAAGEKVIIVGFGSWEPRERQAREGRNPKTGETMTIPESTIPTFSPGKDFKEKVKGGAAK